MNARATTAVPLALVLAAALSACHVGEPARPVTLADLGLADRYSAPAPTDAPADAPIDADAPLAPAARDDLGRWWRSFDDPLLSQLIERGVRDNLEVRRAALREKGKKGSARALAEVAAAADIATGYVTVRAAQAMRDNVRSALAAQDEAIRLSDFRREAQLVSALDGQRARAERERIAGSLPALTVRIDEGVARIAVLTGQPPAALRAALAGSAPVPVGPAAVSVGTPADLLERRPDLVGEARSGGGLLRSGTAIEGREIAYKRAVLAAIEQVENAQAAFAGARARAAQASRALAQTEQTAQLARKNYREGQADFTTLKDVEAALLAARNEQVLAGAERARALIALYVALGGGWQAADPPSSTPGP